MIPADTKPVRVGLHVKVDADLAQSLRVHCAMTRETAREFVSRVLRKALEQKPPRPAA